MAFAFMKTTVNQFKEGKVYELTDKDGDLYELENYDVWVRDSQFDFITKAEACKILEAHFKLFE